MKLLSEHLHRGQGEQSTVRCLFNKGLIMGASSMEVMAVKNESYFDRGRGGWVKDES